MSILGNNLLAEYYAQNQGLPFGYEAVEYLESSGSQYIDTGFRPDYLVKCDVKFSGLFNNRRLLGARNSSGLNTYDIILYDHSPYGIIFRFGTSGNMVTGRNTGVDNKIYTVSMTYENIIWNGNIITCDTSKTSTLVNLKRNVLFFAANLESGISQFATAKMYYCKFSKSGVLLYNFIPCVRKSDGKPGLFDLCKSICPLTGTPFYINSGTGEFVTP